MNILITLGFVFVLFALAFVGLALSAITKRRDRPGSCAHDPTAEHAPGREGCEVCGGNPQKCCQTKDQPD